MNPAYIDADYKELDKVIDEIIKDNTKKKTVYQYCTSILGYLPNDQQYTRPPWKSML